MEVIDKGAGGSPRIVSRENLIRGLVRWSGRGTEAEVELEDGRHGLMSGDVLSHYFADKVV